MYANWFILSHLDVSMMSAFLASLEGGLVEEKDVETKSQDAKERIRKSFPRS